MICLALDTTLDACSVAVVEGEHVRAAVSEPMARGHQERLAPMVAEAMAAAGVDFPGLERIGVTVGPGSFTGLRVGLAFARATALALAVPCVGVGTLRALAEGLAPSAGLAVAAIDARRGQLYVQAFRDGRPVMTPEALSVAAAVDVLLALGADARTPVAGSGAGLLAGIGSGVPATEVIDPVVLARLAMARPPGETPPQPLYLRAPDARTLAERAPVKLASA
jgi:tRNA threonylcarbamoyladenosine biosynthesis protein TsaB